MKKPQASIQLSSETTIDEYLLLVKGKEKDDIIVFLRKRFEERYIQPMGNCITCVESFSAMAIGCLLIETLETFRLGFPNSKGKSECMFISFFGRYEKLFSEIDARSFYKNIRCGILHQAETTQGWRLTTTEVDSPADRVINVPNFVRRLKGAFDKYMEELCVEDWESPVWNNLRNKMDSVCKNCEH